jgi:hypothetical protein
VNAYANPGLAGVWRVLTLREVMDRFQAGNWFEAIAHLSAMEMGLADMPVIDLSNPPAAMDAAVRVQIASAMDGWQSTFQRFADSLSQMGCESSAASARRIGLAGRPEAVDTTALREGVKELRGRLADDLKLPMFFVLTPREGELYASASAGGAFTASVADAFPSALYDSVEATKCLALGRTTACVFHLMRVMEIGLTALGARLAVPMTHKPGWEGILKKANGQMTLPNDKKDPDWIKDEAFLSDAMAMLIAVKTAWRNPTMHMEKTYTDEQAKRIWESVRGFMQQLATGLHE